MQNPDTTFLPDVQYLPKCDNSVEWLQAFNRVKYVNICFHNKLYA